MATTLVSLRDRIETTLQDTGNLTWAEATIDEGITSALANYTKTVPQRKIGTVTLSADGREVDISSLTGLIQVERVWWIFTAADPEFPPNWRDFEQYSRILLFINDGSEPQSGDVVRIWYTLPHTLDGLNSATATTLPPEDDSLIVCGASAICALMRAAAISETMTIDGWSPQRMREWGAIQWHRFRQGLELEARKEATRASGIAPGPRLDRYDDGSGWH